MTKAQIKSAIQGLFNKVFDRKWNDTTIEKLMDLSEKYGDGHRWCSYQHCLEAVIKGGNKAAIDKAFHLYNEYLKIEGATEVMNDVAKTLNFMNF